MRKIYIRGCIVVAIAFGIWGLYCLSIGDNERALMLFYGALICLVAPSKRVADDGPEKDENE